jgi:hypothetical protein
MTSSLCSFLRPSITSSLLSPTVLEQHPPMSLSQCERKRIKISYIETSSILLSVRSKAYFCGRLTTGIVGTNPAQGMDVRL